jgi:HK97 family phage major capsid protein
MQSIQDLRERRTVLAQSVHKLLDDHPGDKWTPQLQDKYDQTMAEIEVIGNEAKRVQAALDLMTETAQVDAITNVAERKAKGAKSETVELYSKWLRGGDRALNAEEWGVVRNTMSTTTQSQGGYTVPTEVAQQVADALKAYGGVRAVADVISTSGSNPINFPTSDGTSETGELIAENATASGADPSFGVVTLTTYKFSSKIVAVPFELLQDSAVDMEAFIRMRLATRLGRVQNTYFTTGTGSSQPNGVVTAAASGKVGLTGQTLSVIFDDLVDLVHSVDTGYRNLGNCRFMMNDSSLKVIRKIKDSSNRPIFIPGWDGLAGPMADTLLGYPVTINQDVAVMAANAKSILFGDFKFYKIREEMGATIFRFDDSAYVKLGQIGFLAWVRAGGNLADVGGCLKYYQNSAS